MGPFKGEVPVFARLWPVQPPWRAPRRRLTPSHSRGPCIRVRVRVSFTTGAIRSAILATAGLLDIHLFGCDSLSVVTPTHSCRVLSPRNKIHTRRTTGYQIKLTSDRWNDFVGDMHGLHGEVVTNDLRENVAQLGIHGSSSSSSS